MNTAAALSMLRLKIILGLLPRAPYNITPDKINGTKKDAIKTICAMLYLIH